MPPIDTLTLVDIVAPGIVALVLWIRASRSDGETRRRWLLMAIVFLVVFLASGISSLSKLPMPLAGIIALIVTAAMGIMDVFLWIQWSRTPKETRRQLLGLAIGILIVFLGSAATALSKFL